MEIQVKIDEDVLIEFDQAAGLRNLTRNAAVREAFSMWLSQARRDQVIFDLYDDESDVTPSGARS